ncbi:MAG: hypothetical protein R2705_23360 [Ilumatobacteraceae bacterium]
MVAWLWSVIGGSVASAWWYAASTVQLAVFARRAGRFGLAPLLGPLLAVGFVAMFVAALVLRRSRRTVTWRGRRVHPA